MASGNYALPGKRLLGRDEPAYELILVDATVVALE